VFAAEWPEEERGLAGEERARAFAWLAGELGFSIELEDSICSRPWEKAARDERRRGAVDEDGRIPSKANGPVAHRTVVASLGGRRVVADAGMPLPSLVSLEPPLEEIPSSFGTLSVAVDSGSRRVLCDARGEVSELLLLGPEARGGAPHASAPFALRLLDDRVLYWADGLMTILDAWSVLTYPLASPARAAFESLFALSLEGVELPDVPAAAVPAALTVFHALPVRPEDARSALALSEPPDSLVASRSIAVAPAPGGSLLSARAVLAGEIPPAGPGESVRKTLVFHLAMELLGAGPR
jgi:hypothetical protein